MAHYALLFQGEEIDFTLPEGPQRTDPDIDSAHYGLTRSPTDTPQPGSEVMLHLREIPAHQIEDPQMK
jgi:hypothetical protein